MVQNWKFIHTINHINKLKEKWYDYISTCYISFLELLKTMEMHSIKVRGPKSVYDRTMLSLLALRDDPSFPLSGFARQSLAFLGMQTHQSLVIIWSSHFVPDCGSIFSSYEDTRHWIRAHHNPQWPHLN